MDFKNTQNSGDDAIKKLVNEHFDEETGLSRSFAGNGVVAAFFGGIILWILDSVQVIIIALAIFIVFHLFIVSPHTIDGPSMEPNFCNGDVVLADKLTPLFNGYEYGDVIIFKKNDQEDYIKRIIGMGGDRIKVQNGRVYRNGEVLNEVYLPDGRRTEILQGSEMVEGVEYTVPNNKYMVFGDNRPKSSDSRTFLSIDPAINTIKGRVLVLIWPVQEMRLFDKNATRAVNACGGL